MKMTLLEVQVTEQNLAEIVKKKLPYQLVRAIKHNIFKFQEEFRLMEEERMKIAKLYAEKDKDGEAKVEKGKFVFAENNEDNFKKEFGEFLQNEIDVDIMCVPENVVEQVENERYDALTTLDLIKIDFMIEKQEDMTDGK